MEDTKLKELYESVIKIEKKELINYLKCPLCKGILRTPYTINECMHTFCKSCIFKYFYGTQTKDYCPVCELKLGGKPMETLIFDNSIAVIIEILFPEFEILDKEAIVKY
jgi:hypothetical protein